MSEKNESETLCKIYTITVIYHTSSKKHGPETNIVVYQGSVIYQLCILTRAFAHEYGIDMQ